jgi:hypothetical protein
VTRSALASMLKANAPTDAMAARSSSVGGRISSTVHSATIEGPVPSNAATPLATSGVAFVDFLFGGGFYTLLTRRERGALDGHGPTARGVDPEAIAA